MTERRRINLVICVHRVGPYHSARYHRLCAGGSVTVLEMTHVDTTYAWESVDDAAGLSRVVAFPAQDPELLTWRVVRARVAQVLDALHPTVLVVPGWGNRAALAVLHWGQRASVPMIMISDSNCYDRVRFQWSEFLKTAIVRCCHAGFVAGTDSREYLCRLGMTADRIRVGADVVDNDHFAEGARVARYDEDAVRARLRLPRDYFLACARFVAKKNLPALLTAFRHYLTCADGPKWDLVLVGDGPQRRELETLVHRLGVRERVHFLGFRQVGELPAIYGLARGLVHVSTEEQWGLVVNEAMACGLPVIVSRKCGCARDLVSEGENGFVIDATDPRVIAAAMARLASPAIDRRAMGHASSERISTWGTSRYANALWELAHLAADENVRCASRWQRVAVWLAGRLI